MSGGPFLRTAGSVRRGKRNGVKGIRATSDVCRLHIGHRTHPKFTAALAEVIDPGNHVN
jgi:hypothetical protein